ncbi:MAG: hypothetical protein M1813_008982 [Trichoglossum hirsutum]|nr:MAG: hypothetical protein M1813_008982 [Trichoglossum hirsutum]
MHTFSLVSIALPLLAAALPQPGPGLAVRQSYLVDTEYPHLLVPLKQDQPDVAFGTQYTGAVKQIWQEVSFDVPNNAATLCTIEFHFPSSGSWQMRGNSPQTFKIFSTAGMGEHTDTFNNHPTLGAEVGQFTVDGAGNVVTNPSTLNVGCRKGQTHQFTITSAGGSVDFEWFGTWHLLTLYSSIK